LNVYPLNVPALRERKEDIPLLAGHFCERIQRRLGLGPVRINPDSFEAMTRYDWPGNVRELENIISRAVLKASFDTPKGAPVVILPSHLGSDLIPADIQHSPPIPKEQTVFANDFSFNDEVKAYKIRMIRQAIDKNDGNWAAAARDLNMHRSNLHNLAKRLGLKS
jgi:anaerobic nitric oxide reductase transcription regulator